MNHNLTSLKHAENLPAGFARSAKIADIVASLTPSQMRDIVLDNRDCFPELSELSEYEITKKIMIESAELRNRKENKKKFNLNYLVFGLLTVFLILIIALILTSDFNTEILPAVAGYPY